MQAANAHRVVGLHQVKRMQNYSFCHCLYVQGANSLYAGSYLLEHLNTQLGKGLHMQEHVDTIEGLKYLTHLGNLTDTAKKLYNARTIINTSFKFDTQRNTT